MACGIEPHQVELHGYDIAVRQSRSFNYGLIRGESFSQQLILVAEMPTAEIHEPNYKMKALTFDGLNVLSAWNMYC